MVFIKYFVLLPLISSLKHTTLLKEFIVREVTARYAGSFAGVLWTLIHPVVIILIYIFIFSIVLRIPVSVEETGTNTFSVFFLAGFFPWLFFSETLAKAPGILMANANLITKVVFPVELLSIASTSAVFITNGIGYFLFLVFIAITMKIHIIWLCLPLILLFEFFFTLGIVYIVSSISVFIRDIAEFITIGLLLWFYGTPIIYPASMMPDSFSFLITLNPMALFVSIFRDIVLLNTIDLKQLLIVAVLSMSVYSLGSWFFIKLKPAFGDVL